MIISFRLMKKRRKIRILRENQTFKQTKNLISRILLFFLLIMYFILVISLLSFLVRNPKNILNVHRRRNITIIKIPQGLIEIETCILCNKL